MIRPTLRPTWRRLLVALGAAAACSAAVADLCIDVEVQLVRPQQGALMLAAFDGAERFGREPVAVTRVPAGDATTRFSWCLPQALRGNAFAVTMFQDLDGDGKLGRTLLGLPAEPWAASGRPGPFGPEWSTTRVTAPAPGSALVMRLSS